jgi:iron complex transport system ATP-binding protein
MVTMRLEALGARYGKNLLLGGVTTPVFRGGEVVAVIGPNAAGKSTLFRRVAGLLHGPGHMLTQSLARARGKIVFIALHDLNHALCFCDQTMVIAGGRLVACGATPDPQGSCARSTMSRRA